MAYGLIAFSLSRIRDRQSQSNGVCVRVHTCALMFVLFVFICPVIRKVGMQPCSQRKSMFSQSKTHH